MSFAYPEFLFALAAISVPIIIHLFNFRRFKTVYFSDIRFLKDVEVETKSRNQLKNLLILLSRILAIAFLVMAFARPFLPSGDTQTSADSNSVVVYIDNSFSMNAEGEKGNLLEEAKAKAIEVASVYKNGSEIRLLTNDFNPRHFRNLSFEEFKNEVSAVQTSPQLRTFDNVVSRASGISDAKSALSLYYLSDFQKSTSTPQSVIKDSLLSIYMLPSEANINTNIYIDSCWFESPSRLPLQPDELKVKVRNSGQENVENVSVKLTLNGVQRAVGTTNISASSFEEITLGFTNAESGLQFAEISLQDFPITYDDKYHLSYDLTSTVNILSINGNSAPKHISNLFNSEGNFNLIEISDGELDYSLLSTIDLLVCNEVPRFSSGMIQELMNYVKDGGSLFILPSESKDRASLNELLLAVGAEQLTALDSADMKVEGVNLQSDIFKNVFTEWQERVDLPSTKKHFTTAIRSSAPSERLLTLANGLPILTAYRKGNGKAYVLASVLRGKWSNFHRHALFVPALYNMAVNSVSSGTSDEIIGSNQLIETKYRLENDDILEVENLKGDNSFMPERVSRSTGTGIMVHDQVKKHGHFLLSTQRGDTIQPLSFNYNRLESDLTFLTPIEFAEAAKTAGIINLELIEGKAESIANRVQEIQNGKQLWRWFLLIVLICLFFEIILIRIL